ncbi:PilZ domain-containing protein [Sphingosinicella sp.]|uniref:PilZ domain-containing protein n=1 Tax=Sphingosinicella sp. TaxID=1917971 RepID=UPI004037613A
MDAFQPGPGTNDPPGAIQGELSFGSALKPARARNADRMPVALRAGLRQRGASAVSVQILDLSTHGFRIDTHLSLEVGNQIWLRLPGLEATPAHVAWVDGHCAGCAFDRPLHPAVLSMIIARSGGCPTLS